MCELSTTKTSYENLKQELEQILQQNQTLEQERDKYRQWLDEFEDRVQVFCKQYIFMNNINITV